MRSAHCAGRHTGFGAQALVISRGFALTLLGGLLAGAGVLAAQRSLQQFVFGVTPSDPVTMVGVVLVLSAVSMIACLIPAWRAARSDPAMTLRE